MGATTDISWCDATWTCVVGCDYVSPGCGNCYATNTVHRFSHHPNPKISLPLAGLTTHHNRGRWTGKVSLMRDRLDWPARWRRPRKVFVTSLGDLFHDDVPDDFLLDVFRVMHRVRRHTYQVLTKRPERMADFARRLCWDQKRDEVYLAAAGGRPYLPLAPHVWLGTSVENQEWADRRVPVLLKVPAAVRFLSVEPMLGPVDLTEWLHIDTDVSPGPHGEGVEKYVGQQLHWVIVGGESGPSARPFHLEWVRDLLRQTSGSDVKVWVKQLGTRAFEGGRPFRTKDSAGREKREWPKDLRVQQMPEVVR